MIIDIERIVNISIIEYGILWTLKQNKLDTIYWKIKLGFKVPGPELQCLLKVKQDLS